MNASKMWRQPKQRLRYTTEHSLMLLKEVLDRNPFEDPYRWTVVHENFVRMTGRSHSLRSVREHVDYLLKLYVKGALESKSQYKKNDEEHQEKVQMLQEVLALKEKYFEVVQERKTIRKRRRSDNYGIEDCEETTEMFLDEELADESILEQKGSNNISPDYADETNTTLQYLKDNDLKNLELRKKTIELKERKLCLAETEYQLAKEKFELEKEERMKRLEMEIQERTAQLKVLEQQQKLINLLFQQFQNNYNA